MKNSKGNRVSRILLALLPLLMLGTTGCAAQALSFVKGPVVDDISWSTARVVWSTSAITTVDRIRYGTTPGQYPLKTTQFSWKANRKIHSHYLSGLAADTLYYFVVCGTSGAEVCSAEKSFRTKKRGTGEPQLPQTMTESEPMPQQSGATLTVGPDCNDATTGLMARWNEAQWGDTIVLPAGMVCRGQYTFGAKTPDTAQPHRWIVVRSSGEPELPPVGVRITPENKAQMAKLENIRPAIDLGWDFPERDNCVTGETRIREADPAPFKLWQCLNLPESRKAIQGVTQSGAVRLTVPNHGFVNGQWVHVAGVDAPDNANGTFKVKGADQNSFVIEYMQGFGDVPVNGAWVSGGYVEENGWRKVTPLTGAAPPATCTPGQLFHRSGQSMRDNTLWCTRPNFWQPLIVDFVRAHVQGAVLSLEGTRYVRFTGIEMAPFVPPDLDYLRQYTPLAIRTQHMHSFWSLAAVNSTSENIVFDRCFIHGESSTSRLWYALIFQGRRVAVRDSMITEVLDWTADVPASDATETSAIYIPANADGVHSGPFDIRNNSIECVGICVYVPSDSAGFAADESMPEDVSIVGNHISWPEHYLYGRPGSLKRHVTGRHLIEFKLGKRILIQGNLLQNTWQRVNQAAAIALTPRLEIVGASLTSVANGSATCAIANWCAGFRVGELAWLAGTSDPAQDGLYKVLSGTANSVVLEGLSGSSTGGRLQRPQTALTVEDVTIDSNRFENVANGIFTIGHSDGSGAPEMMTPGFKRLRIHNNLFVGVDGSRVSWFGRNKPYGVWYNYNGIGGYPLYVSNGLEDLTYTNNTTFENKGGYGFALENYSLDPNAEYQPSAGLVYQRNVVWMNGTNSESAIGVGGVYFAENGLDQFWKSGSARSWVYENNLIAVRGDLPLESPFGPYPNKNREFNIEGGSPFSSLTTFELKQNLRKYGIGVNASELEGQMQNIRNQRLSPQGRNGAFLWLNGPSHTNCYASRRTNGGAWLTQVLTPGPQTRFWAMPQLPPQARIDWRVSCGQPWSASTFYTLAAATAPGSAVIRLSPPAGRGVVAVRVQSGLVPNSLTSVHTFPCGTDCLATIPGPRGNSLIFQWQYLNAAGTEVARSGLSGTVLR
jgi:hypothetical protein